MSTVTLHSMQDDDTGGFVFDPLTGIYKHIASLRQSAEGTMVCGFADVRAVGLRGNTNIFAAIYARDNLLHVALPPQLFTWPGPTIVRRRSWLSRAKSFEIANDTKRHVKFFYTFIDSQHGFPGPEAVDIFYMIAWKTSSPEMVRTTIELWQGMAQGDIASGHSRDSG